MKNESDNHMIRKAFGRLPSPIKIQHGDYRVVLYKEGGWNLEREVRFGAGRFQWIVADGEPTPHGLKIVLESLGFVAEA